MNKKPFDIFKSFEDSFKEDLKSVKRIVNVRKYKRNTLEWQYARLCNFLSKRYYYPYVPIEYVDVDIRSFLNLCHKIWMGMFETGEISFCNGNVPSIVFKKQKDIKIEDYFHESYLRLLDFKKTRNMLIKPEELEMKFFNNSEDFMKAIIEAETV